MKLFFNCTFLFLIIMISQSKAADDRSISKSGKIPQKTVMLEENWNESNWIKNLKTMISFDSTTGYYEEIIQKWNGSNWDNTTRKEMYFDKFKYNKATISYKWSSGQWILTSGFRSIVDTILKNGNRLVLYDVNWNPALKGWVADDSIFYDSKSRIKKRVVKDTEVLNNKDTVKTITLSENIYQNDNIWIEVQSTWRSNSKQVDKERYRYRRTDDSSRECYSIDYWDDDANRWIPNTARLYRQSDFPSLVYDSLEEFINNKFVPVYVSLECRDPEGNLMQQHIYEKKFDESTGTWSGTSFKWDRTFNSHENRYIVAESTFVLDQYGKSWVLTGYENNQCRFPFDGGYTESGSYEDTFKMWEFDRSFDTLLPCGLLLSGENYCDIENKKWLPLTDFSYTQMNDSAIVVKSYFNIDKKNWINDSLFSLKLSPKGQVISRINHVWIQNGLFSGKWNKISKISYLR
ncbi:MAG: hypothetical protein GX640_23305 [Fibrobacter sp.]|nr:hypothetical protein [Fibrobacter sp.]